MRKSLILLSLSVLFLLAACCRQEERKGEAASDWKEVVHGKLPLLGHRNWIVITDMAYPLQSNPGILTLYAGEPYEEVLAQVQEMLGKVPHVYPHVYQDQELSLLKDDLCPGIEAFRQKARMALAGAEIVAVPHEQLIARLDSASRLFQVVIIKTPLAMPYTSTFLELDCKYWDAEKQAVLTALSVN